MSLTTDRHITTDSTTLTAYEMAHIVEWGDEHGLEVVVKVSGADHPEDMAFVGYGDGIASWIVYRAEGDVWLGRMETRAGQGFEGSKTAIGSVEDALAEIITETEA